MPFEMKPTKFFLRFAPVAFALFAGFFLMPAGRAQPAPLTAGNRFLFIFDTSADMKQRRPAVQAEVNELLATSMGGRLRAGDSLGVWTFDQDLRTGQFPLQHWRPEDAMTIASSINQFVGKQPYANGTRFNALQPQLNQLIQNSARLTVLIFCDGKDEIKWTPYDASINQAFQQRLAGQNRTRQPFVLVLRTQLGQYAGCTVNFPPGMVSVPEFPPLPPPPAPPPTTNSAPMTPTNIVPAAPTNPVVSPLLPTNPAPAVQTNAVPAPPANLFASTNPEPAKPTKLVPIPPFNPMTSTNPVAPPLETSGPDRKGALAIGGVLLIGAGALDALAVFRSRRTGRGSLITRSMRKD